MRNSQNRRLTDLETAAALPSDSHVRERFNQIREILDSDVGSEIRDCLYIVHASPVLDTLDDKLRRVKAQHRAYVLFCEEATRQGMTELARDYEESANELEHEIAELEKLCN